MLECLKYSTSVFSVRFHTWDMQTCVGRDVILSATFQANQDGMEYIGGFNIYNVTQYEGVAVVCIHYSVV